MWKLISEETQKEVKVGDAVTTFRGDRLTVKHLSPPHHAGSCGHFFDGCREMYVTCINCKFMYIDETAENAIQSIE